MKTKDRSRRQTASWRSTRLVTALAAIAPEIRNDCQAILIDIAIAHACPADEEPGDWRSALRTHLGHLAAAHPAVRRAVIAALDEPSLQYDAALVLRRFRQDGLGDDAEQASAALVQMLGPNCPHMFWMLQFCDTPGWHAALFRRLTREPGLWRELAVPGIEYAVPREWVKSRRPGPRAAALAAMGHAARRFDPTRLEDECDVEGFADDTRLPDAIDDVEDPASRVTHTQLSKAAAAGLRDASSHVRCAALYALIHYGDATGCLDLFRAAINDVDSQVRHFAAWGIARNRCLWVEMLDELFELQATHFDPAVRAAAVEALEQAWAQFGPGGWRRLRRPDGLLRAQRCHDRGDG